MPFTTPIKIEGLIQFQGLLRQAEADAPKQLRQALMHAGNIVFQDAIGRIPVLTGETKGAARLRAQQRKVEILVKDLPWWAWLDFGGKRRGRGGGIAYRKRLKDGRYFWASFKRNRERVQEALEQALLELARILDRDARLSQHDRDFAASRAALQQRFEERRQYLDERFRGRRGGQ